MEKQSKMTPTDRIKQEAVKAFPIPVNISQQPSCMDKREGYIAGATATHDRAKVLVDALEALKEGAEGHTIRFIDKAIKQWEGKDRVTEYQAKSLLNLPEDTDPKGMPPLATDPFNTQIPKDDK